MTDPENLGPFSFGKRKKMWEANAQPWGKEWPQPKYEIVPIAVPAWALSVHNASLS